MNNQIQVFGDFPEAALDLFGDRLRVYVDTDGQTARNPLGILTRDHPVPAGLMTRQLQLVSVAGVDLTHIDVAAATARGIPVQVTPEAAGSDELSLRRASTAAVRQAMGFLFYGNLINAVNFPSCAAEPAEGMRARVTVTFRGDFVIPAAVNVILAQSGVPALEHMTDFRDGYGYTILDRSDMPTPEIIDRIQAVAGVLAVRVLLNFG